MVPVTVIPFYPRCSVRCPSELCPRQRIQHRARYSAEVGDWPCQSGSDSPRALRWTAPTSSFICYFALVRWGTVDTTATAHVDATVLLRAADTTTL